MGIGSALVDILIHEDDDFLKKAGVPKGGMIYVDNKVIDQVMAEASEKLHIVPGGSACNTIVGIGQLGGAARFIGKLGQDDFGKLFEKDLRDNNIEPLFFTSPSPTGRVLSIITPDAQRSMLTYLGASSEARAAEITAECFDGAAIVHIEGYLLYNKDLMMKALELAKDAGVRVSLDLASFTVVEESKDFLEGIVDDFVDILIANEDEARLFTGCSDEAEAIKALAKKSDIAVLKVGKRGSFIAHAEEIVEVAPKKGRGDEILDTTGAGDLWASGFLFGLVNGYTLEKCGQLGSMCGYEVCRVVGANIPAEGWERIKNN
ncbi:MAG: adenosine kinase [Desulfobacteraceae bacterium 4572_88]|nr:MAG: adenosine kinase [Desulfobacteraceae bacterium 4572_88]